MNGRKIRNGDSSFLEKYGITGILILMIIFFSLTTTNFFTVQNFSNILINQAVMGCLALGGMFILIVDEFDLSLGYILCFSMVLGALLAEKGVPGMLVPIIMAAAGAVCGLLNGLITTKLGISSFIGTLSVGLMLSGISQALSGGGILNTNIPSGMITFARGKLFQIGYCVIFLAVLCLLVWYILNFTSFGRQLYAVGSSKRTALFAGIKVQKVRILAFTAAGFFCGIAAVVLLGQLGAGSSAYGTSLLLPAYSVVFLSKAAFTPGKINVPGMILGMLLCALGENGIEISGVSTWGSYIFQGVILILSIWISAALTERAERVK